MRKVFAYLCQSRQLDNKLVSELAHDGLLYQDKRGNAVFLHKDEIGKSIGAEIQGTNSEKRYKGVELAKQMLDEYMRGFEARNPNLKVFNAVAFFCEAK